MRSFYLGVGRNVVASAWWSAVNWWCGGGVVVFASKKRRSQQLATNLCVDYPLHPTVLYVYIRSAIS